MQLLLAPRRCSKDFRYFTLNLWLTITAPLQALKEALKSLWGGHLFAEMWIALKSIALVTITSSTLRQARKRLPDEAKTNLQLACYQLGVVLDGFKKKLQSTQVSGAQLVYLASKNKSYSTREQDPLIDSDSTKALLEEIAVGMGGATFTARKNDMCKQCKVKPSCPLYLEGKAVHQ